jgi:hypothetical protein
MGAKFLDVIPQSGTYPEYHFGEHFRDRVWIEFEDNNYNKWFGCFARSPYKGLDKVIVNNAGTVALIISNGAGYLIEIDTKKLLYHFEDYPSIESAICTANPDYFVVGTFYSIIILNKDGLIKEISPDFSTDGIYFTQQEGTKAVGDLSSYIYGDLNVRFVLDLITFEITVSTKFKIRRLGPWEYITISDKDIVESKAPHFLHKIWRQLTSLGTRDKK